jgi:O-antigen ligase
MSRQAMIGSTIIFVLCTIVLLVKGRNKLINFAVIIAVIAALAIYISVCWDQVSTLFSSILAALDTGSGRTILYEQALENFAKYPIFGIGFCSPETTDYAGELVFPLTYHDTILQFLGSCGAVGLFAYGLHRAQTVISYVKNITVERTFVALTILALLIVSIFDNHLFHFFPTLVYSMLVAVMVNSEKLKD